MPRKRQNDDRFLALLPYDEPLLYSDCSHLPSYRLFLSDEQPLACGLCMFKQGWDSELPSRIHLFKQLAENGNPETSPKFFAHMFLVAGLTAPAPDEVLTEFRRKRGMLKCDSSCPTNCREHRPLAREQYTEAAWRLFPVGSALWKLMGYQPPLGIVLVKAIAWGRSEQEIARELDLSLHNVGIRMTKALRTALGYLPRGTTRQEQSIGAIAGAG